MIPIQKVLQRITWDQEFGAADFTVGYYDRVVGGIICIPFREMKLAPGDRFLFRFLDPEGGEQTIPFHRIREVYRNGVLIWQRPLLPRVGKRG